MTAYQIQSVGENGKRLPPDKMFEVWVQLAGQLAELMPDGPCRQLCEEVHRAVTTDEGGA